MNFESDQTVITSHLTWNEHLQPSFNVIDHRKLFQTFWERLFVSFVDYISFTSHQGHTEDKENTTQLERRLPLKGDGTRVNDPPAHTSHSPSCGTCVRVHETAA